MMMRVSRGNSERKDGGVILFFLLVLSLATFHGGCAGVTGKTGPGDPPPTVSIISPTSGATVSASTMISAIASANAVGVQFKLDGTNLGSEKTSAPFSISWDTTTTANGQHTLAAVARNAAGQTGNSAPMSITVQNSSGSNPPVISGVSASPGSTSAYIFWTTDKPSDSQVDWGTASSYGQSSALDSSQVTGHSAILSSLTSSTLYHYRVKSKDAAGNLATSGDSTFTTMITGSASLSALAAQMQPGTWAELITNSFFDAAAVNILSTPLNGGTILEYANEATWDPVARQLFFLGSSHHGIFIPKFVTYSEDTNGWLQLSYPGFDVVHGYNHQALDPMTETYYHRPYNSSSVYKYNIRSGTWGQIPDIPWTSPNVMPCCGALTYFPEMSRLIFINGQANGELYFYNPTTNQWTVTAPLNITASPLEYEAQYLPVYKLVIFGGGIAEPYLHTLYKIDANGLVTRIADPLGAGVGINFCNMTADPASGKLLVFSYNGASYEYDPGTNAWRQLPIQAPSLLDRYGNFATVAVPIPNYGVVAFVKADGDQSKVYLYKHTGF